MAADTDLLAAGAQCASATLLASLSWPKVLLGAVLFAILVVFTALLHDRRQAAPRAEGEEAPASAPVARPLPPSPPATPARKVDTLPAAAKPPTGRLSPAAMLPRPHVSVPLPDGLHGVRLEDGSHYYGELHHGLMHGRGIFVWPNGECAGCCAHCWLACPQGAARFTADATIVLS